MKIFVINTGSSSIKYQLFNMDRQKAIAFGLAEKIGEPSAFLTHNVIDKNGKYIKKEIKGALKNHRKCLDKIVNLLVNKKNGVIGNKSEIIGVGHRVVHGGETYQSPAIINQHLIDAIKENTPLAPLHNPPNLVGIEVAGDIFPDALQVAVFDTAFHQTIPPRAFLYAIPFYLYEEKKVRRYGFHGTSHSYVALKASEWLGHPMNSINMITIHLGNGGSMSAIKQGKCIDTTMGMTPLDGLVMGTRSGDLDPAIPFFLTDHLKMSNNEINKLLNEESGLKGLCGINDMREILKRRNSGDQKAALAIEVYTYRVKKYIGAFYAVLGTLDAVIFTAGIGENAPEIRSACCEGLENFGLLIDNEFNNKIENRIRQISSRASTVKILVVPTNEELKIAQETKQIIDNLNE